MIHLINQSGFNAGMQSIRVAIINKLAQISSFMSDISTVLGVSVHWIDSLSQTLAQGLSAINAKLVEKGSTAAADYSEIAGKIEAISTVITPTGTISITQNGTGIDVEQYAQADVNVPNDDTQLKAILDNSIVEFTNDNVTSLSGYAFYRSAVKSVNLPNCTSISGVNCFQYSSLRTANIPNLLVVRGFTGTAIQQFVANNPTTIGAQAFDACGSFTNLVIRRTSGVTSLENMNAFRNTPFRSGTGGTLFVPYWITVSGNAVLGTSSYSSATNWSALESTTFASIQENLITLNALSVDITDYYTIVTALPTSDIATDKVYFIETQTAGTYEQWFYGSGSWVQLPNITLGGGS